MGSCDSKVSFRESVGPLCQWRQYFIFLKSIGFQRSTQYEYWPHRVIAGMQWDNAQYLAVCTWRSSLGDGHWSMTRGQRPRGPALPSPLSLCGRSVEVTPRGLLVLPRTPSTISPPEVSWSCVMLPFIRRCQPSVSAGWPSPLKPQQEADNPPAWTWEADNPPAWTWEADNLKVSACTVCCPLFSRVCRH